LSKLESKSKKSIIVHPFLFALYPVLFLFSFNIQLVSPEEIILPAIVIILISFGIWIVLSLLLKNYKKAGMIVSLGLVLFFLYGHIYNVIGNFINDDAILSHVFLLSLFITIFGVGTYFFIKTKKKLDNITKIVNVIAISLVGLSLVNVGMYYIDESNSEDFLIQENEVNLTTNTNENNYPDIIYLLFDGYSGYTTLKEYVDFDNQEIIDFLTDQGFYVAEKSYSNYPWTRVSIPSILNMDYMHYQADELGKDLKDRKVLAELLNNNKVMEHLKSKGYTIYNFNTNWSPTSKIKAADITLCQKDEYSVSELEIMIVRTSMLNPIHVQFFAGDKRDITMCIFSTLATILDRPEDPKFVFAHILLPHQPYIFGPNGEPVVPNSINLDSKGWSQEAYLNQLQFANKKIKELIPNLVNTNDPPIIIFQSDHGMRYGKLNWGNPHEDGLKQRFTNFLAYYLPDKGRDMLLESSTPVNTFRILFNSYLGDNFELLEDRMFGSRFNSMKNFTDYSEVLIKN